MKLLKFFALHLMALGLVVSCNNKDDDGDGFDPNVKLEFKVYGQHLDGDYPAYWTDVTTNKTAPGYLFFEFVTSYEEPYLYFGGYELEDAEEEIEVEFRMTESEGGNPFTGKLDYTKVDYNYKNTYPDGDFYVVKVSGYFKNKDDFYFECEWRWYYLDSNGKAIEDEEELEKWIARPRK